MKFYKLRPPGDGEYGGDTVRSDAKDGPALLNVTLELDSWRGDCLIAPFPTCFVSVPALREAEQLGLTGFRIDPVIMDGDLERYPDMPDFVQFTPTGLPGRDDFATDTGPPVVIMSERAFAMLQRHVFQGFRDFEDYRPTPARI